MAGFFEQVTRTFTQISIQEETKYIETRGFLEATENVVKLFDFLNSTAFGPVKSDMNGNMVVSHTNIYTAN